jgi:hypothetical protein
VRVAAAAENLDLDSHGSSAMVTVRREATKVASIARLAYRACRAADPYQKIPEFGVDVLIATVNKELDVLEFSCRRKSKAIHQPPRFFLGLFAPVALFATKPDSSPK